MKLETNLINSYLLYCETQKKLSPHTLKAYRIDLKQFIKYFKDKTLSKNNLNQYITFLHQKFKPKTVKRKIASINSLFTFLEYEEIIEENPLRKIRVNFKTEKILPKTITRENLIKFYIELYNQNKQDNKTKKILSLRNIAIIELMMTTGLRVSEVCNLKIESINFNEKYIKVFGKGSKERIIQIDNNNVYSALKKYDSLVSRKDTCRYFFLNIKHNKLSEQTVRNVINDIVLKAEIKQHITPHMFRHSFATMLLEDDVDIRYIQKILGHSSIITTQIYTHITSNKQREILKNKNPRNKINISVNKYITN